MARDHLKWLRIHDHSPVADIDPNTAYRKETSDDGGRTWEYPRPMTGKFLRLTMTDALYADCSVEQANGVVTMQSPYPMGGLIRYTPTP